MKKEWDKIMHFHARDSQFCHWDQYLVQRDVVNRRPVDFEDPVSYMNGVLHIWTDAVWFHPE